MGAIMEDVPVLAMEEGYLDLPPGFRFHPTDEEIITHYLLEKAVNEGFSSRAIGDVDLNKSEPWELPSKAKMGEKEWYFFCCRDRKYPTGMRTNRATEAGYWKATGKDKEIYKGRNCLVGMKKTLVFYKGRAPKGEKTNWVMHEFRLEGKSFYDNLPKAAKDAWVVCRVFHKNAAGAKKITSPLAEPGGVDPFLVKPSFKDDYLRSPPMPPLMESPYGPSSSKLGSCFMDDGGDGGDFKPAPSSSPNPFYLPSMGSFQDLQNCFLDNNNIIPFPDYNNINPTNPRVNNLQNPPHEASVFSPQAAFPSPSRSLQSSPNVGVYPPHATLRAQAVPQEREGAALGLQYYYNNAEPQYSNQTSLVTASQDTALSADRNAEISSVFSKHGGAVGSSRPPHDDVGRPSTSAGQPAYPGSLWKY